MIDVITDVTRETERIIEQYGMFNSAHELYAVLQEEVDEFWDSVKINNPDEYELIQVAAVAITGVMWARLLKSKAGQ